MRVASAEIIILVLKKYALDHRPLHIRINNNNTINRNFRNGNDKCVISGLPIPSPPPPRTPQSAVRGVAQCRRSPQDLTLSQHGALAPSASPSPSPSHRTHLTLHSAALHERIRAHPRPSVAPRLSLAPRHCCRIHPGADRGPSARARPPCCSLAPIGPSAAWPP